MNTCCSVTIQICAFLLGLYLWSSVLAVGWSTPGQFAHQPQGTYFVRYQLMRDDVMVHVTATQETPTRPRHIDTFEHYNISLSYWLKTDPSIQVSLPSITYRKQALSCSDAESHLSQIHNIALDFDCDPDYPVLIKDLRRPKQVDLLVSVTNEDPIVFGINHSLTARWLGIWASSTLLYIILFLCGRGILFQTYEHLTKKLK